MNINLPTKKQMIEYIKSFIKKHDFEQLGDIYLLVESNSCDGEFCYAIEKIEYLYENGDVETTGFQTNIENLNCVQLYTLCYDLMHLK